VDAIARWGDSTGVSPAFLSGEASASPAVAREAAAVVLERSSRLKPAWLALAVVLASVAAYLLIKKPWIVKSPSPAAFASPACGAIRAMPHC